MAVKDANVAVKFIAECLKRAESPLDKQLALHSTHVSRPLHPTFTLFVQ